ncbi:hypothetical protein L195_g043873 [Trifolium pratense]|uniref:Uncharacterized protein n=1 Tax=Trifolium pratense TaxID=57577 RepID=A0A2K3MAG6_TRIPR|nr:hypothetical protein L195_g043873 [Trifolium pratense]
MFQHRFLILDGSPGPSCYKLNVEADGPDGNGKWELSAVVSDTGNGFGCFVLEQADTQGFGKSYTHSVASVKSWWIAMILAYSRQTRLDENFKRSNFDVGCFHNSSHINRFTRSFQDFKGMKKICKSQISTSKSERYSGTNPSSASEW